MKRKCLLSREVRINNIEGDGNCLFRAVGDQLYGSAELHGIIRSACMDYIELDKESFSNFVCEYPSIEMYIGEKRKLGVWGDNIEIQALSELYQEPIYIYRKVKTGKLEPGLSRYPSGRVSENIFGEEGIVYELLYKIEPRYVQGLSQMKGLYSSKRPVRLLYYNKLHYDSLFIKEDDLSPIISLEAGMVESRNLKSLRKYILRENKAALPPRTENIQRQEPDFLTDKEPPRKSEIYYPPEKARKWPGCEASITSKRAYPFFRAKTKYRDEPNPVNTDSGGEPSLIIEDEPKCPAPPNKQIFAKLASDPLLDLRKSTTKPAHSRLIKSIESNNLGVVDRYAKDTQLSSHQKELKRLLSYASYESKKIIEILKDKKSLNRYPETLSEDILSISYEFGLSGFSKAVPTVVTTSKNSSQSSNSGPEMGFASVNEETALLLDQTLQHHRSGGTKTLHMWGHSPTDKKKSSGLKTEICNLPSTSSCVPNKSETHIGDCEEDIFEGVGNFLETPKAKPRRTSSLERSSSPEMDSFVEEIHEIEKEDFPVEGRSQKRNQYGKPPEKSVISSENSRAQKNPFTSAVPMNRPRSRRAEVDYSLLFRRGPMRHREGGSERHNLPKFQDATSSYAECYLEVGGVSQYETHHEEIEPRRYREMERFTESTEGTRSAKYRKRQDKSVNREWKSIQKIMKRQNSASLDKYDHLTRNFEVQK
ncbi:OTU-like cysteine protease family protein [Cryptosporidium felis]|nr:OTU-like cysteine protease family protein [Cryptosporidium felis]